MNDFICCNGLLGGFLGESDLDFHNPLMMFIFLKQLMFHLNNPENFLGQRKLSL